MKIVSSTVLTQQFFLFLPIVFPFLSFRLSYTCMLSVDFSCWASVLFGFTRSRQVFFVVPY